MFIDLSRQVSPRAGGHDDAAGGVAVVARPDTFAQPGQFIGCMCMSVCLCLSSYW